METIQSIKIRGQFPREPAEEYFGHSKQFWEEFAEKLNSTGLVHVQFFAEDGTAQPRSYYHYTCLRFLITRPKKPLAEEMGEDQAGNTNDSEECLITGKMQTLKIDRAGSDLHV